MKMKMIYAYLITLPLLFVPGWSIKLSDVHPGFERIGLRPAGFEPKGIGGMDFLPDGRLAIAEWGGNELVQGALLIVTGADGDSSTVQVDTIARDLREPLGLINVDDTIFVLERGRLLSFTPQPVGQNYKQEVVATGWPQDTTHWHNLDFGLVYKHGYFHASLGNRWDSKRVEDPQRATWIRISRNGEWEIMGDGLRNCNGLGFGPNKEIFTTDNQGHWLPSSKLIHLVPGRHYGYKGMAKPFYEFETPESPPAVWMPHGKVSKSPSEPLLLTKGIYQGQVLVGDITLGGIKRIFLEKVDGEYQGCVFRFTDPDGLECGVNRLREGDDGSIYVGGAGGVPNQGLGGNNLWNWNNTWTGLEKLVPNDKVVFEPLSVHAQPDGFSLLFTMSVDQASLAENIKVKRFRYEPSEKYGGKPMDETTLTVQDVSLEDNNKHVKLNLGPLLNGYIYHIQFGGLRSQSGDAPWATETWYTLNYVPDSPSLIAEMNPAKPRNLPVPMPVRDLLGKTVSGNPMPWEITVPGKAE